MNALILLILAGIVSMFLGVFKQKQLGLPVVLTACVLSIFVISYGWAGDYSGIMNNMLIFDNYSHSFIITMIAVSIGIFFSCHYYYNQKIEHLTDLYALFMFSLTGGIILVSFHNLVMLFLGTEILSIPLYILASSNRRNLPSNEAGLKYYLMGSFATCFLLLGITLIYGATGSFDMVLISQYIMESNTLHSGLFNTGFILILCAFIFKLSAVPFHFWAPDVYEGAPTVLTTFVATVVKIAVFGALIRFLNTTALLDAPLWQNLITFSAFATMIFGNILSIYQSNFKRLLAYSGIANVGFLLVAITSLDENTYMYVIYYLAGYSVATIIGFTIYSTIKKQTGIDSIDGIKGLLENNNLMTLSLIVIMLSYAGIPPLAGFFGKYFIFSNALKSGQLLLVIVAVVSSVLAAYNYLRVIANAVQKPASGIPQIIIGKAYRTFLIVGVSLLLILGILPDFLFNLIK